MPYNGMWCKRTERVISTGLIGLHNLTRDVKWINRFVACVDLLKTQHISENFKAL